jgi:hypothetical protein
MDSEAVAQALSLTDEVFMFLGSQLEAVWAATAWRWGPNPPALYYHRPPSQHVAEFILLNLFVAVLFLLSRGYTRAFSKPPFRPPIRRSSFDRSLGAMLMMIWLSQVLLKAVRHQPAVQILWLLMPCHLFTLGWAYILLSETCDSRFSVYLGFLMGTFHWGPTAASAFPDWGDHTFPPFEGYLFVFHHFLLMVLPYYFAAKVGYLGLKPPAFSVSYFLHITWVATWVNVFWYAAIGYVSGLNLNYQIYPPPLTGTGPAVQLLTGQYYKPIVIALLIVLSFAFRSSLQMAFWIGTRLCPSRPLHPPKSK